MLDTLSLAASNLISPPILFFVLGGLAVLVGSDLVIPREVAAALPLYLLLAIGFRGGAEFAHSGLSPDFFKAAVAGLALGFALPALAFFVLRRFGRLDPANAGAIAAHYGSISAITFVTAQGFLTRMDVPTSGYMVAVMALMESPGVLTGIFLGRLFASHPAATGGGNTKAVGSALREALLGGSVLLLLGSFGIGLATGEQGMALLQPLVKDLFPGVLALFLLDLGMTAARRFHEFLRLGWFLAAFGLVMPLTAAALGALASALAGLHTGDAALLMTLAASASYIAAPAAVRLALPEANPSLSITLSLGITFPFNILVGIPLYYAVAQTLLGAR